MQKKFLTCCLLLASTVVLGQKQYVSASETYFWDRQPAVTIVLNHSPKVVIEALEYCNGQRGILNGKHPTTYVPFLNTALMQKNKKDAELIFRVGLADEEDYSKTVVYLMLNSIVESGLNAGEANQFALDDALTFLDNLALAVNDYAAGNLKRETKLQTILLAKSQRQEVRCTNRCSRLDSKKEGIQQKVTQNRKSAVKRDNNLARRISARQTTLAYQKKAIAKQKHYVSQLNNQQRGKVY